ncbi:MAG: tripartite tricarboxylate transporter substrate-binding protein [Burkholderiales bacterium]|nr:tripartite tricarboxylate transporter substrate-binding protein [Burkholderiales bacterium]
MKGTISLVAGALLASGLFSTAGAQAAAGDFPARPVRMIVPGSPATGMDNMGRVVARGLTELFKQQVIVDNRAGAGSLIGSGIVAGAAPDGYTIGVASTSTIVAPMLQAKPPFNPVKDFVNIALLSSITSVLVVAPEIPAKNLKEFIEYAKARPGKLNFASIGSGSAAHLTPEIFNRAAGIQAVHVPFKSVADVVSEMRSSRVHYLMFISPAALPMLQDGKLRALAVTSPRRYAGLPDVPTVGEAGLKGAETDTMIGIIGPVAMPRHLVARLHADIVSVLRQPDTKVQFERFGGAPAVETSRDAYAAKWKAEHELFSKLLPEIGLKPQ